VESRSSHTAVATRSLSGRIPPGLQESFCLTHSGEERVVDGESIGTHPRWRARSVLATSPTTTALQQHAPPKLDAPLRFRRVFTANKGHGKRHADKAFVNRELKDKGLLSVDWRIALDLLESYSYRFPTEGGHHESYITVREKDIGYVIGRFGDTLRCLQERSGCLIEVTHKRVDDGYFTVRITGTEQGTIKAKKLIDTTKPGGLGLNGYATFSSTITERELERDMSPTHWSSISPVPDLAPVDGLSPKHREGARYFTKRVRQLSASPVTRRRTRFFRSKLELSLEDVARTIGQLFERPQNRPFITTRAVNEALKFFITHNLVASARKLFADSESHYLAVDTTTFNIMLRGAAKAKDLHSFTFLLGLMVKRNVRPDSRTWCTLLAVLDRKEARSFIVRRMEEKKLLSDPEVVREVCRQIMSDVAADWLDALKDPLSLPEYMEERFTAAWYSASAINRYLDELGKRGMMQEAWKLLEAVDARGLKLNSATVNTILTHCLRYKKGDWAVQLFRAADDRWGISPDGITYRLLFKISWTLRLYNMARVVWRYACIAGAVDFRMYRLVKRSLQCHARSSRSSISGSWRMTAGRAITGVNISGISDVSFDQFSGIHTSKTIFSQSTKQNDKQIDILSQDLATFGKLEPVNPLSAMLSQAFAMDQIWWTNKISRDKSLSWKLQNAIHIPMKPIPGQEGSYGVGER
jgi:pentatricopeptide repeat protein